MDHSFLSVSRTRNPLARGLKSLSFLMTDDSLLNCKGLVQSQAFDHSMKPIPKRGNEDRI